MALSASLAVAEAVNKLWNCQQTFSKVKAILKANSQANFAVSFQAVGL